MTRSLSTSVSSYLVKELSQSFYTRKRFAALFSVYLVSILKYRRHSLNHSVWTYTLRFSMTCRPKRNATTCSKISFRSTKIWKVSIDFLFKLIQINITQSLFIQFAFNLTYGLLEQLFRITRSQTWHLVQLNCEECTEPRLSYLRNYNAYAQHVNRHTHWDLKFYSVGWTIGEKDPPERPQKHKTEIIVFFITSVQLISIWNSRKVKSVCWCFFLLLCVLAICTRPSFPIFCFIIRSLTPYWCSSYSL